MDINSIFKEELDRATSSIWSKSISLKRNEFLAKAGQYNPYLYFVETGALRIFVEQEAEELTIRFGYQGSFISSLDSFLGDRPSTFSIQALKKSQVKVIHKKDFKQLLDKNISFLQLWQKALEQLVLQQLEREIDILTQSPQERYKRVLQRSPQLFQEVPNKYIASYLRMSPETLSRLKKS